MEQQPTIFAPDAGQPGEIGQGGPFVHVLGMDLKLAGESCPLFGGGCLAAQLEGGGNSLGQEFGLIVGIEAG